MNNTAKKKSREFLILKNLRKEYTTVQIELTYKDPLELLVATILSAQCTDERVNIVTKQLFNKYDSIKDYANANIKDLQNDIRSTGFFRNKAKNIKHAAKMIIKEYASKVPNTMEDLLRLPGVARKTANIVLTNGFGKVEGIAVDTHVKRLSKRLDFSTNINPDKIETDLMNLFDKEEWSSINHLLIKHGRKICKAINPLCNRCVLSDLCPSAFKIK